MPGKLTLEVLKGPVAGKRFEFEEHDTFVVGRVPDCHVCLPDDDRMVSRHHFIVEANPPDARIRDLGSLNGTYVNGAKHGGRSEGETPEEGAKRRYPEVDLKDGDQIRIGQTLLQIQIEIPVFCCECGVEIKDKAHEKYIWIGGTFICTTCREKAVKAAKPPKKPEPARCQQCGKDISKEIGVGRRGDYECASCRIKAEKDPMKRLMQLIIKENIKRGNQGAIPTIEGYQIEEKLGQGGMGAVYRARRKKDGKIVAVKVMLSRAAVDERSRRQFSRELDVLRQLHHKHIVEYIDDGSAGTAFYFIQEFCESGSVSQLLRHYQGRLTVGVAGPIMLHVLEGLAYAHEAKIEVTKKDSSKTEGKGVVHRDLKPDNIFLAGTKKSWIAKVGDYGLAKCFDTAGLSGMTITGHVAGTAFFMPREQVLNYKLVKPVSDVWSIGATFYNMLTGQFPRDFVQGQDPIEMVLHSPLVPIRKRDASIQRKLAAVIDRSLAVNVKDRYQDAGEMFNALQKVL